MRHAALGARGRRAAVILAASVALLAAARAGAHGRSVSWSTWDRDGREARVVLRIDQLELTRLPWGPVAPGALPVPLAHYLTGALRLLDDGGACPVVEGPRALAAPEGRAAVEWRLRCAGPGALRIESALLREAAPGHLHFVRVRGEEGGVEAVLRAGAPPLVLPGPEGEDPVVEAPASPLAYLVLGVEHIATGADHLVFLLGLLLLARRPREVAVVVTGFTLAHGLTLALAVLGRLRPETAAVEALIGLSIALVGTENAWLLAGRPRSLPPLVAALLAALALAAAAGRGTVPGLTLAGLALFVPAYFGLVARSARPMRLRTAIAFVFGLVHGFGFAAVLAELSLEPARLATALLGFHLGVELGQLAAVAAAWPLLRVLAGWRGGRPGRLVAEVATAGVAGLGVFWLVARGFGAAG